MFGRWVGIITGAITRSVRTSTIGPSIVARVAGRAGVAWFVAGVTGFVSNGPKGSLESSRELSQGRQRLQPLAQASSQELLEELAWLG
jgi:hypothetical protein